MAKPIKFDFRADKVVSAVAYFALKCPGLTKLKVCKLLFYADKGHLLRYGRPITGDRYYRLPYGPVPTRAYDILKGNSDPAETALFDRYVSVVGNNIFPRRNPDLKAFSKSDLEVLRETCERYGQMSASELASLSHKEPGYVKTSPSSAIDYRLFFESDPQSGRVRELTESEQEARDLLFQFRAEK